MEWKLEITPEMPFTDLFLNSYSRFKTVIHVLKIVSMSDSRE